MLETKAVYNLLRLKKIEDPSLKVEEWALEDLRKVELDELFSRLQQNSVNLEKKAFIQFANQTDTPEELTDLLFPDSADPKKRDPFYLIVFELWRRLLPEKQSLSIFGDELDHQINLYDQYELESDELIQDSLANFIEILDENADAGADPKETFKSITNYCAHDVESFIYDYILEQLDDLNPLYASELIEGFSSYMIAPFWMDFLRIRLLAFTDIGEANLEMHSLLSKDLELSLLLEIIRFLSTSGEHELFKLSVKKALPYLHEGEELVEVMEWIADYYRGLDEDEKEQMIQKHIDQIEMGPLKSEDLRALESLLV